MFSLAGKQAPSHTVGWSIHWCVKQIVLSTVYSVFFPSVVLEVPYSGTLSWRLIFLLKLSRHVYTFHWFLPFQKPTLVDLTCHATFQKMHFLWCVVKLIRILCWYQRVQNTEASNLWISYSIVVLQRHFLIHTRMQVQLTHEDTITRCCFSHKGCMVFSAMSYKLWVTAFKTSGWKQLLASELKRWRDIKHNKC